MRYEYVYDYEIRTETNLATFKDETILYVNPHSDDWAAFLLRQRYLDYCIPSSGFIRLVTLDEFTEIPKNIQGYFPNADYLQLAELDINNNIHEDIYIVKYHNYTIHYMCDLCGRFPRENEEHNVVMVPSHIGLMLSRTCIPCTAKVISRTVDGKPVD